MHNEGPGVPCGEARSCSASGSAGENIPKADVRAQGSGQACQREVPAERRV